MQELRWKLIMIAAIAAVFGFLAATQPMNLGLDLKGGIHLVMRVDVDEAIAASVARRCRRGWCACSKTRASPWWAPSSVRTRRC